MAGLVNVDVGSALSGLGSLARSIRAAVTGKDPIDAAKAVELALELQKMESQILTAQAAINLEDAKSGSMFRGGWRPFIGWACGVAVALTYVVKPVVEMIAVMAGKTFVFPNFDMTALFGLLTPMLGIAIARSFDKRNGDN